MAHPASNVSRQPSSRDNDRGSRRLRRILAPAALAGTACLAAVLFVDLGKRPQAASAPGVSMVEPSGPPEAGQYWPRWRGPSGQGLVEGSGYPDTWSNEGPNSKNIVWKAALPGSGNSSPIIWGDRIYLTTAYDGGRRRSILCLRRSDGQQLWETFAPAAAPEKANRKNGHASGTPSTDGERVYAYFGNHGLLSVDLAGRRVWHEDFGELSPYHGSACSPLLYRDRVIIYQAGRNGLRAQDLDAH